MKKFNASGFTAAGVLVLALSAGAVGGVMAVGGDAPAQQPPAVTNVQGVAEEETLPAETASPAPVVSAAPTMEAAPQAAPEPRVVEQEEPVASDPTETAQEAADRAEKAAKRAEDAAEKVTPAPTPVPTPAATPKPPVLDTSYDCPAGSKYRAMGVTQTRVKNPTIEDCGGPA